VIHPMGFSEIEQVNAIIGLSIKNLGRWPSTLADLGYALDRIELEFSVPDPNRAGKTIIVNPDLLFVQDERNFSLIAELKSGKFQDFVQLDRFVAVTSVDLVRYASLPIASTAIAKHQIGVIQFVNGEHADGYLTEFQNIKHKACLVSIADEAIKISYGSVTDSNLHKEFEQGVSLTGCRIPTNLVPVLPTTNDKFELVKSVVLAVSSLWASSARTVTPEQVAIDQYGRLWECFDRKAKNRYLDVAKETLRDMQRTEFNQYLRPVPSDAPKWTLLGVPHTISPKQLTKKLQQFKNTIDTYKWRVGQGRPYKGYNPSQTSIEDIEGIFESRLQEKKKKRSKKIKKSDVTGPPSSNVPDNPLDG